MLCKTTEMTCSTAHLTGWDRCLSESRPTSSTLGLAVPGGVYWDWQHLLLLPVVIHASHLHPTALRFKSRVDPVLQYVTWQVGHLHRHNSVYLLQQLQVVKLTIPRIPTQIHTDLNTGTYGCCAETNFQLYSSQTAADRQSALKAVA